MDSAHTNGVDYSIVAQCDTLDRHWPVVMPVSVAHHVRHGSRVKEPDCSLLSC
jgi:hypothetical protein